MKFVGPIVLGVLFLGVLFGQFFRIDAFAGSSSGILILDIVLVIGVVLGSIAVIRTVGWRKFFPRSSYWLLAWATVVLLGTLFQSRNHLPLEIIVAFGYLGRLFLLYTLMIISYHLFERSEGRVVRYFAYLVSGLLVLGGVILAVLPDFSILVPLGWDPHQYRFTSTWLDPNYLGSFLGLAFTFFLALLLRKQFGLLPQWALILILALLWIGIYLTFSRSALATVVVGGLVVTALTNWRYVLAFTVLVMITLAIPSRFQDRFQQSVAFTSQRGVGQKSGSTAVDPTASARLNSWKRAIDVAETSPLVGVGYNYYQFAQLRVLGDVSAEELANNRSAAGSDSSLLTFLATMGVVGITPLLMFWFLLIRRFWQYKSDPFVLAGIGLIAAWFISSFLNNTLPYVLIAAPMMILLGISWKRAGNND